MLICMKSKRNSAIPKFLINIKLKLLIFVTVRDRYRTKAERDILARFHHPFIVRLHYGKKKGLIIVELHCGIFLKKKLKSNWHRK